MNNAYGLFIMNTVKPLQSVVTVPGANPGAGTIFKSGVDVNGCTPDFQSEGGGSIPPHRTNLGGRSMAS